MEKTEQGQHWTEKGQGSIGRKKGRAASDGKRAGQHRTKKGICSSCHLEVVGDAGREDDGGRGRQEDVDYSRRGSDITGGRSRRRGK